MTHQQLYTMFHPEQLNEYNSHLPALWDALELTDGTVVEMGMGDGSTIQLHEYCEANGRRLVSIDQNKDWFDKFSWLTSDTHTVAHWPKWDIEQIKSFNPACILVDHAPGDRRANDAVLLKDINGILVLHDTEPAPTLAAYGWENAWPSFRHRKDYPAPMKPTGHNGAWCTLVSNVIDLNDPDKITVECDEQSK